MAEVVLLGANVPAEPSAANFPLPDFAIDWHADALL